MATPVAEPVDYNTQPVPVNNWWGLFGVACFFMLIAGVAVMFVITRAGLNKNRVFRDTAAIAVALISTIIVTSISTVSGYWGDVSVTVWNDRVVQSAYYPFVFAAVGFAAVTIGLFSYLPPLEILNNARRSRKNKELAVEEGDFAVPDEKEYTGADGVKRTAGQIRELDIYTSTAYSITPLALLAGVLNFFIIFSFALQQSYPLALWPLIMPTIAFGIFLIVIYIVVFISVVRLPHFLENAKNLRTDKKRRKNQMKSYWAFFAMLFIHFIASIVLVTVAWALSPALGTDQPTFSTATAATFALATLIGTCVAYFIGSMYINWYMPDPFDPEKGKHSH